MALHWGPVEWRMNERMVHRTGAGVYVAFICTGLFLDASFTYCSSNNAHKTS